MAGNPRNYYSETQLRKNEALLFGVSCTEAVWDIWFTFLTSRLFSIMGPEGRWIIMCRSNLTTVFIEANNVILAHYNFLLFATTRTAKW